MKYPLTCESFQYRHKVDQDLFYKWILLFVILNMLAGCGIVRTEVRGTTSNAPFSINKVFNDRSTKPPSFNKANASFQRLPSLRFTSYFTDEPTSDALSLDHPQLDSIDIDSSPSATFLGQETIGQSTLSLDSLRQLPENHSVWHRLTSDQSNYYSGESLLALGFTFGTGAAIANTEADTQLHQHFQTSVRGARSVELFDFLHANKELGNGLYTLPIMGAAWLANEYVDGPPAFEHFGTWGERSMRGFVVGAPPLIVMQRLTGGSRPYETNEGSQWHPFRDNNGVSGHAFMSSLPFITAAKMTDNPWEKSLWYLGSTLGPLSRVNDNAHYPSQIGIGWAMAFVAATAVQQSDTGKRGWRLLPEAPTGGSGFAFRYQW